MGDGEVLFAFCLLLHFPPRVRDYEAVLELLHHKMTVVRTLARYPLSHNSGAAVRFVGCSGSTTILWYPVSASKALRSETRMRGTQELVSPSNVLPLVS